MLKAPEFAPLECTLVLTMPDTPVAGPKGCDFMQGDRPLLAIALANKLARIAWSVLARGRTFEARRIDEATTQTA